MPIPPAMGVILSAAPPFNAKFNTSFKPKLTEKNVEFFAIASD